jgi:hypothetical protein
MPHILDGLYDDIPNAPPTGTPLPDALLLRIGENGEGLELVAAMLTAGEPEEE